MAPGAAPLTVWRITDRRHVKDAFSGEGARLYGGRWNFPGTPVVYTAARTQSPDPCLNAESSRDARATSSVRTAAAFQA